MKARTQPPKKLTPAEMRHVWLSASMLTTFGLRPAAARALADFMILYVEEFPHLRRDNSKGGARLMAASTLFAALPPRTQALMLRHLWRLIPRSKRRAEALAAARPFVPSEWK